MSHLATINRLIEALADHSARHPERAATSRQFIAFAAGEPECLDRRTTSGHFTASAFVVSGDGLRTHLATAALREATEETGLANLVVEGSIFDLDRHWIPARPAEPGHWHYDVRFLVRATSDEQFRISRESLALAWRNIADLAVAPDVDESLGRMARRWLVAAGSCR
jgi:8-oxo-dGTP pyrophosphatase MutT (NUDIX family)